MIYIDWNPLVSTNFSIDGEFQYKEGFVQRLKFESGKERTYLKNSYVPKTYPQVSLLLDNQEENENERTEFEEFLLWFEKDIRFGALPFLVTKIGYRRKWYIKEDEKGIYMFLPESINYDSLRKTVLINFGLEEMGIIPEVEHTFLAAEDDQILLSEGNIGIVLE